jgi:hypothetical protein
VCGSPKQLYMVNAGVGQSPCSLRAYLSSSACILGPKNNSFSDGRGFWLMRQFMFAIQNTSDGEAERVSSVANLQQPRSTRQSTLPSLQTWNNNNHRYYPLSLQKQSIMRRNSSLTYAQ